MKFCPRHTHSYSGLNGIETTVSYVTKKDVQSFHGELFTEQWLKLIENKPTFLIDKQECYYYADYKHFAIATDMYINNA